MTACAVITTATVLLFDPTFALAQADVTAVESADSEGGADAIPDPVSVDGAETPAADPSVTEADASVSGDAPVESAASEDDSAEGWGDIETTDGGEETRIFDTHLYGYIDSYFGLQADAPTGQLLPSGQPEFGGGGYEWDVLNLHVMVQGTIAQRFRYFVNLAARSAGSPTQDEAVSVRNAWVEMPVVGNYLLVRAGKTYRRFGLYNEILDAVPTFIGIEPPEMFDVDHLLLTRTTNFMIHGSVPFENANLQYALSTGMDESIHGAVPIGFDVRLDVGTWLRIGSSGYYTGGQAGPSRDVGDGSPRGGVINWMAQDEYWVLGAFAQILLDNFTLQAEYFHADHDARRDPEATLLLDGEVNASQASRLFVNGDPSMGVNPIARYAVNTFYVRSGYRVNVNEDFSLTPYVQVDWYSNPETIHERPLGGDNEAGISSDGAFWKLTAGSVIRPIPQIALKVDGSMHFQNIENQSTYYPELRVSLSYLWEVQQ